VRRRVIVAALVALLAALIIPQSAQAAGTDSVQAIATTSANAAGGHAAVSTATTAKDAPEFRPGLIISDDSFFNDLSMSARQIQHFFDSTPCVPQADAPCLADFRQTTTTQPNQFDHCTVYRGARDESASRIIAKVAAACGISPRVLVVLLQKEQSLVTRPSAYGYQRATGYACPDTAACDTEYFGFFNQVYNAAWQFREYGASSDWRYHVGRVAVQYSPNASCGSRVVDIRNQATADLYNYTPYQPDDATLADPKAAPGACSTYGNLNFWRIYSSWFGDPTAERLPDWWGDCLTFAGGGRCPVDLTQVALP
jgi:hypothetical protein